LDATYNKPLVSSSADLKWRHYKATYFDPQDEVYEIDYFDGEKIIGNYNTPYPLTFQSPIIYAVIRTPNPSKVMGEVLHAATLDSIVLGNKYLIPGTFKLYASRVDGKPVTEGRDYVVDYNRGIILPLAPAAIPATLSGVVGQFIGGSKFRMSSPPTVLTGAYMGASLSVSDGAPPVTVGTYYVSYIKYPSSGDAYCTLTLVDVDGAEIDVDHASWVHWTLTPTMDYLPYWDVSSSKICSYEFRKEVFYSASGQIKEMSHNSVRELSLWVPEVLVDRFTLYNNYGSMLNRFAASSETYKAFLRGVMHLYTSGPKLYVVEAALNVAAGYPVIRSDGEILTNFESGINTTGTDGVMIPGDERYFTSASAAFTSDDIGGWLVVDESLHEANHKKFKILSVVDEHTLELESEFQVVAESSINWTLSWYYQKIVTTKSTKGDLRKYAYPLNVPMRTDLLDPSNYNILAFEAFEILTTTFVVTDYIEDPQWWHNKYIPSVLWANATAERRFATTKLYASVFDPLDDFRFDDPGGFFDADDQGIVVAPTRPTELDPITGDPLPADIYRHGAAFSIMDQYLKFHMFFVDIDKEVDLSQQFRDDLANIVLIVKPSYTYPYVESGDMFIDTLELYDLLVSHFGFEFGEPDSISVADCNLKFDQPYCFDDFYAYNTYTAVSQSLASPPVAPFTLAVTAGERIVQHMIHADIDSERVLEGRDYTIDLDPDSLTHGLVTPLTTWDTAADITFTAKTVVIVNEDDGVPDTTLGFTPLMFEGLQPGYVRATISTPYNREELVERAIEVTIDTNYPSGVPYTYL
jgi:hypothetical protein